MLTNNKQNHDIFDGVETLRNGDLHFRYDPQTNLHAIIAIDSTELGPALGGCRCIPYASSAQAITDALRLAKGMTYKAAITGLAFGGGKSVILRPETIPDRQAFFASFGRFVNDLGGRYITAMDSGTETTDMDAIATQTRYVTSVSSLPNFPIGDPSPTTAYGVFRGIEAAVHFQLQRDSLEGIHVAIQGVGHVGYALAKRLHDAGATLTVADPNQDNVERCVKAFKAKFCTPEAIIAIQCDVFAPCALGAILNDETIKKLKTTIVAGAANNQLAKPKDGTQLHERGILYAPDYVINAGGLIYATAQYHHTSEAEALQDVETLYDTLHEIFQRAKEKNLPTSVVADHIALEKLEQRRT